MVPSSNCSRGRGVLLRVARVEVVHLFFIKKKRKTKYILVGKQRFFHFRIFLFFA